MNLNEMTAQEMLDAVAAGKLRSVDVPKSGWTRLNFGSEKWPPQVRDSEAYQADESKHAWFALFLTPSIGRPRLFMIFKKSGQKLRLPDEVAAFALERARACQAKAKA